MCENIPKILPGAAKSILKKRMVSHLIKNTESTGYHICTDFDVRQSSSPESSKFMDDCDFKVLRPNFMQ